MEIEIESLEDEKYDLEERVEELEEKEEKYDELKSDYAAAKCVISMKKDENEVNKKNMFKFMKENKELREWVDRNQDEINRLRDVIEEEPPAPQVPWFLPLTKL